ncbi:AbrB/MazE/SpoVT family DNA-binding domain-containing protein [Aeromicrobium sp. CTD01-1L150]|uniref:AbrB/MazE/SpoVT family DNA-binding domain-containing protein n=1 Tax=Aeromicrobium sp. CTD01-1L150 TaxID=3341830 RepID=UPI0035C1A7F3
MATAKVTSKGQITIPREVRTALGLETGSRVEFVASSHGSYELVPASRSIKDLKGVVQTRGRTVSLEEIDEAVAAAAVERSRQ